MSDPIEEVVWELAGEILSPAAKPRAVYGPSTVSRIRRTNAELDDINNAIVAAVENEHPVTLRGVFYRVVSAGAIEKTELGYRVIMRQLLKLRRAGIIPYGHITDGTRWLRVRSNTWDNLDEMLADAASSYRRMLWQNQHDRVYILSEKDAISGVIEPITLGWHVPLGILRGYASETFAHTLAGEILANAQDGRHTMVYQLGDHDPSGVDAWRDFVARVSEFVARHWSDPSDEVTFQRLAVTEAQIQELDLPTRPTKSRDPRSSTFAGGSVEVDAIPASTLRELVENAITQHINPEALRLTRLAERSERDVLARMIGNGP